MDFDDEASEAPKKKHWFQLRKPRRYSEGAGDAMDRPVFYEDEPEEGQGRSFTVVRARRASQPMGTTAGTSGSGGDTEPSSGSTPGRSFVVVRGKGTPPAAS